MLTIRNQQQQAFETAAQGRFVDKLCAYLTAHYPDSTEDLKPERLERLVRLGIDRARSYGITWDSQVGGFVSIMFEIAPEFDEHPRIQELLNDKSVQANARLRHVMDHTSDQDWKDASRHGQIQTWKLDS